MYNCDTVGKRLFSIVSNQCLKCENSSRPYRVHPFFNRRECSFEAVAGWRLLGTVACPRSQVSAPHSATAEVSRSPVSQPATATTVSVSVMIFLTW